MCSPVLEVNFWHFGQYLERDDAGAPSSFIEPASVLSQACRLAIADPQKTAASLDVEDADVDDEEEEEGEEDEGDGISSKEKSYDGTLRGDEEVWITIGLTKVRQTFLCV